ncbi:MAG: DUF167 domain-containing protein [Oceanipulchritudo sp.]
MLLKVRVIPNASREEIVGMREGILKVKLQAVPEGGRANKALCRLLAGEFGCRTRQIRILSGEKSRDKVVELPGTGGVA